jgi:hypothetical protein
MALFEERQYLCNPLSDLAFSMRVDRYGTRFYS